MTLLILIGWCLLVAAHQSKSDATTILAQGTIFHVSAWITRAVLCGGTALALASAEGNFAVTFPLFCGVAYGVFTPAFRWMLNRRRGLPLTYISPGNEYDWQFIRLTMGKFGRTELVEAWHVYMAASSAKMAGVIAYAVELCVLAASTIIYLNT